MVETDHSWGEVFTQAPWDGDGWNQPFAGIWVLSAGKGEGVGLEEVTGDSCLGGCLLVFSVSTR